jgi:hypothetical protein
MEQSFTIFAILIGALTMLSTVLIGWQLYTTINLEKRIKSKVSNAVSIIRNELIEKIDMVNYSTQVELLLYQSRAVTSRSFKCDDFTLALNALILALDHNTDNAEWCISYILLNYKGTGHIITPAMYEGVGEAIYNTSLKSAQIWELKEFIRNLKIGEF